MTQEDTVDKILAELTARHIAHERNNAIIHGYLMQAYGAGYEYGLKQRSKRKAVARLDDDGNVLEIYESQKTAANSTHLNVSTIRRALIGKFKYAGGYRWKWADEKPPSRKPPTIATAFEKQSKQQ